MQITEENQQHIDNLTELEKREELIDRAFNGLFSIITVMGYVYLGSLLGFKVGVVFLLQYTGYRIGRSSSK